MPKYMSMASYSKQINEKESTGPKIMGVAIKHNEFILPVTMKINNLNICTHVGN